MSYNKFMNLQNELNTLFHEHKSDFADIFVEQVTSNLIVLENNKLDKILTGTDSGKGKRRIKGAEVDYSYSTISGNTSAPQDNNIDSITDLLFRADKAARSVSKDIKQVTVSYGDTLQDIEVINSKGIHRKGKRTRTRFLINVIAEKDGVLQTGYETAGGCVGFELFETNNVEELAKMAAERAILMLKARHAPSGSMPVVIMSEAGGTLIHEACGHGLEADFIVKGTSVYGKKTGDKVASDLITVVDDATIPGLYGSFEFDDEGTLSQKKILIKNGRLSGYMSDIYNSNILNIASSGNGRRESFRSKPQPRMTNTYIDRGNTPTDEIVTSIKSGFLVKKLGGGQVNVTNGDFVFDVQEGYIIENYKVKEPARGAMLIGNGPKILMDIDMVGSDLHFITGTCGKGDHAPVTDAMPTVRIPEIVVGGRS